MEVARRAPRNFKTCRECLINKCVCIHTHQVAWWTFTSSLTTSTISNSWWLRILKTTWMLISSRWCSMLSICKKHTVLLWNHQKQTIKCAPCTIKRRSERQVGAPCQLEIYWTCQLSLSLKTIWIAHLTALNHQWIIIKRTASGMVDGQSKE